MINKIWLSRRGTLLRMQSQNPSAEGSDDDSPLGEGAIFLGFQGSKPITRPILYCLCVSPFLTVQLAPWDERIELELRDDVYNWIVAHVASLQTHFKPIKSEVLIRKCPFKPRHFSSFTLHTDCYTQTININQTASNDNILYRCLHIPLMNAESVYKD